MAKKTSKKAATTKKAPTKSEVFTTVAGDTGLTKKEVTAVFDSLNGIIKKSLKANGQFTLPGLAKMVVKKKPATKARPGVNPFNGEQIMIKAKPASKTVRIRPLKNL
jgi:nucleoid DNA-binding protein